MATTMTLNGALHNNFVHVHFVQCAKYPLQVLLYCALCHISTTSCTLSIEPSIMFHPPLDFNAKSLIRNRQRLCSVEDIVQIPNPKLSKSQIYPKFLQIIYDSLSIITYLDPCGPILPHANDFLGQNLHQKNRTTFIFFIFLQNGSQRNA